MTTQLAATSSAPATADRTLVLVDLENLCGPGADELLVRNRLGRLRRFCGLGDRDHMVIAANQKLLFAASAAEPGARLLCSKRGERDSADLALCGVISDALDASRRGSGYGRVVIGSGDHIFAGVARECRASGLAVEIAGPTGSMSRKLVATGDRVTTLGRAQPPRSRAA